MLQWSCHSILVATIMFSIDYRLDVRLVRVSHSRGQEHMTETIKLFIGTCRDVQRHSHVSTTCPTLEEMSAENVAFHNVEILTCLEC